MGSGTSRNRQDAPSISAGSNDKFVVLDTLQMANGIKGIISQRKSNALITFSIVREFERDGITDWTSYFSEVQIDDFQQMLDMCRARIKELRADPNIAKPPIQAHHHRR